MADSKEDRTNGSPAREGLAGTTLGRFSIQSRIGGGGMGEVYRASDTKLKRWVALKRVAPQLRADRRYRQRLLKEAQRASSLTSTHIAQIYDVIDEGDETFLVMEYVEGTTLRECQGRRLGLEEFLKLAIQCAEALVTAHSKGVVHCDIKPENIMVTAAGQVKILDFGIARRLPSPGETTTTDSIASRPGTVLGTRAYMAPEILDGKQPDGRADIFSLGVVFYETLTGYHPFITRSIGEPTIREQPPVLTELNPQAPPELESIVVRMLAKDPGERYPSAAHLLADLRALQGSLPSVVPSPASVQPSLASSLRSTWKNRPWLVLAALALLTLLALLVVARQRWPDWLWGVGLPEEKQVAVLRFTVIGGDAESRAFADGLSEALTARLSQVPAKPPLQVVPASEVRAHNVNTAEEARKEFGVNLVVGGALQRSAGMVRVSPVLIDAVRQRQLAGDSIDAPASDPFAVEDRVMSSVVAMLRIDLGSRERGDLTAHGAIHPAAYDYYLQGKGYLQDYQKPKSVESAMAVFSRALEVDKNFAPAQAGLGEAYWYEYELTQDRQWVDKAALACRQAIEEQSQLAGGHACLGLVDNGTGHYDEAVAELALAVKLDPTDDASYRDLASAYEELGKLEEAANAYRQAISLLPQYWGGYSRLGAFYFRHAQYKEAADMFTQVTALAPDNARGYSNLGGTYLAQGRYAEAIPLLKRSVDLQPTPGAFSNLGTAYFQLRRFTDAAQAYEKATELGEHDYTAWGNLADAEYLAPGRRTEAAQACKKAISLAEEQLQTNSRNTAVLGALADYYAMLGDRDQALQYLHKALSLAPGDPWLRSRAAEVYNQLGDTGHAVEWLAKALEAGYSLTMIRDTPALDNLRSDPRFQALMRSR